MHRNVSVTGEGRRWTRRLLPVAAAAALVAPGARPAAAGTVLVSSTGLAGKVLRYDAQTGATGGVLVLPGLGGMSNYPEHILYGKDGRLYIADYSNNSILRFDLQMGDSENFVLVPPGGGGLNHPTDMALGPDGSLYVCSRGTNEVLKYNSQNGAFIGAFVTAGSGGLSQPDGLAFGPDGNLYATGQGNLRVFKYNGTTGAFIGAFTSNTGPGALSVPVSLRFGPDGNLYVASNGAHQVLKFDGVTGAYIGVFVAAGSGGMNDPLDIAFGPDGNLYVADHTTDQVLKYNGITGAFISTLVTAGSGGLNVPYSVAFLPPRPPMGLEVAAMTGVSVTMSWMDVSDDETNFAVWRRSSSSDWTQIAMLPPNTVNFTDTGLTAGVPYAYRVVALNGIGPSVPSELLPVRTPSPLPGPPGGLQAWPIGPGQVLRGGGPPEGDGLGYAIWRKGGGSDWTGVTLLMNPSASGYIDSGLKADTGYNYRIRAIGVNGTSEWSNETAVLTPVLPLNPPSSLAATVVSATQVNLTWTLASTNETGVTVWRKIGAGSFVRIAVLPAGTTSFSDTTTTTATSYTYEVRVNNNYYISPYSNLVSVTTP